MQIEPSARSVAEHERQQLEEVFARFRDEWKSGRGRESSTVRLVMHPAFQRIISLGPPAVPLLLRELEREVDAWFWGLMAITGADPVNYEHRGDDYLMAQDWLRWGRSHGYQW